MNDKWRIVFMGTPDFACPALEALADSTDKIALVITQPDRPRGRGRKLSPPPVKLLAQRRGLPVWQPEKVKDAEVIERLNALEADLFVVVAYGQILSPALLELPRLGSLNVHASLLPAYRGPAPINWVIINGERETGVTTMFQDKGVDTGPVLLSRAVPIKEAYTAGVLHDLLAPLGAELLIETIRGLKDGSVKPRPQPEGTFSRAPLLQKSDGTIDWTRPAGELARQVRGLDPWPGAYTSYNGRALKLFGGQTANFHGRPGQVMGLEDGRLCVAAGQGGVAVAELQLAGHKRLPAPEFWRGQRLSSASFFGE